MDHVSKAIRNRLEEIGVTEDLIAKFFEGSVMPEKKVRKTKAKKDVAIVVVKELDPDSEVESVTKSADESVGKEKTRSRTVSKKMKEAFLVLADGDTNKLESCCKSYKDASEEDIQSKGGNFESFARSFLGLAPPEVTKPKKAKKEKVASRIDRWTVTLGRQLTKIVEESGGKMEDSLKKKFQEWLDAMDGAVFGAATIEGHMRSFVLETLVPKTESSPALEDDDEDMDEFELEGETLWIGLKTGKIFRNTPEGGDLCVGLAGVGEFAKVVKHSA